MHGIELFASCFGLQRVHMPRQFCKRTSLGDCNPLANECPCEWYWRFFASGFFLCGISAYGYLNILFTGWRVCLISHPLNHITTAELWSVEIYTMSLLCSDSGELDNSETDLGFSQCHSALPVTGFGCSLCNKLSRHSTFKTLSSTAMLYIYDLTGSSDEHSPSLAPVSL